MTLDEYFKECEKKGAVPLSYRSYAKTLNGSRTIEYENPRYAKAKEDLVGTMGVNKQGEDRNINDIVSRLYGEEVIIYTKDGCHHGELLGYDGKSFCLGRYVFKDKPMDVFDYSTKSLFSEEAIVPAENIISISRMSLHIEK